MTRHVLRLAMASDATDYLVRDSLPAWLDERVAVDGVTNDAPTLVDEEGRPAHYLAVWTFSSAEDDEDLLDALEYRLQKYAPWWRLDAHECDRGGHEDCEWVMRRRGGDVPAGVGPQ